MGGDGALQLYLDRGPRTRAKGKGKGKKGQGKGKKGGGQKGREAQG